MNCTEIEDNCLEEDFNIIANSEVDVDKLKNKTVLVTGATGLIGANLVKTLLYINSAKKTEMKIVAGIRNEKKARRIFQNELERADLEIAVMDITSPIDISNPIDYVMHCASITSSKLMVEKPVETIITAVDGTRNVFDLAVAKSAESVVYVSSMEVYGSFDEPNMNVCENELGKLEIQSVRSNYPESKRLCENMCAAYLSEYHLPVKIARLAQTFGAGIFPEENRVFAQFARCAINGTDIVLHTEGRSEGNYCYLRDAIKGLLIILLNGADGESYNVSNSNSHTTILNMANMVCERIAGKNIKVVFDIPKTNRFGYAAETHMKLNSDKLQALGWKPEVGLEEAYRRMISSMNAVDL